MFESAVISSSSRTTLLGWLLRKGISFCISLVLHGAVLALLVVYYSPVKILDFSRQDIRNVFIAPPVEGLVLPETKVPETGEEEPPSPSTDSVRAGAQAAAPAAAATQQPAAQPSPSLPMRLPARITEDFRLSSGVPSRPHLPEGLSFQLTPKQKPFPYSSAPSRERALTPGTLTKYLPKASVLSVRPGSSQAQAAGSGPGDYVTRRPESPRKDVIEWADMAVALILDNWFIPLQLLDQDQDEFEISILVQKDGGIISTEVVRPARIRQLEAAALKALELSTPLPRLPRSYPDNNLAIRLVFARR